MTLVGAGVTVFESLKAADDAGRRGHRRPGHRPVHGQADRRRDARGAPLTETGLIVVVEDHWIEGASATPSLDALSKGGAELSGRVMKLGVTEMPFSGTPEELRDWAGISAERIVSRVRELLG